MKRNPLIFVGLIGLMVVAGVVWWSVSRNKNEVIEGAESVVSPDIRVDSLKSGDLVKNPLTITGQARGTWFFEASFPIEVIGKDGTVIAQGYAEAEDDWMTEDFVPYKALITFKVITTQPGEIVLKKDNPSGLPEHDKEIRIPVILMVGEN